MQKLNEKIIYLNNEVEIKQSKIEFIEKRHKNLQAKYLKLLGNKTKIIQENMPLFELNKIDKEKEKEKEKDKLSDIYAESKYLEKIKNHNSTAKKEKKEYTIQINKKMNNISKNTKNNNDILLPEIKNKNNKNNKNNKRALSLQKDNNYKNIKIKKNNALKDINMLLSDNSDEDKLNVNKKEEVEEEDEIDNDDDDGNSENSNDSED